LKYTNPDSLLLPKKRIEIIHLHHRKAHYPAMAEILATDKDGCLPILFDDAFAYNDPAWSNPSNAC
jgi:hypothetical protein